MTMQRYAAEDANLAYALLDPHPDGPWVRAEDAEKAVDAARTEVRKEVKESLLEPIHILASTIGRARVHLDIGDPEGYVRDALRELEEASEAMNKLRSIPVIIDHQEAGGG